jgi:hypothetical protein
VTQPKLVPSLAGWLAEIIHHPEMADVPRDGFDQRGVDLFPREDIKPSDNDEYIRQRQSEAVGVVEKHWGSIQAVGNELLAKRRLTGDEVREVVRLATDGGSTRPEHSRHLRLSGLTNWRRDA